MTEQVQERLSKMTKIDWNDLKSSFVVGSYSLEANEETKRESNLKAWLEPISDLTTGNTSNDMNLAVAALIVEGINLFSF